jgi:ribosomal protein L4
VAELFRVRDFFVSETDDAATQTKKVDSVVKKLKLDIKKVYPNCRKEDTGFFLDVRGQSCRVGELQLIIGVYIILYTYK